jgi:hypothetical protein
MAKRIMGGARLKNYMPAPWDVSKQVLLNVIRQPLITFADIAAAAPPAIVNLFQLTVAQSNRARTNLEQQGILPYPKTYWIRGVRVHVLQATTPAAGVFVPFVSGNGVDVQALAILAESYVLSLKVGEKEFINAPVWYFASGLGVNFQGAAAGAEAANELFATATLGIAQHNNYFKIPPALEIVIPPQQGFGGTLQNAAQVANLGAGAANRVVQVLLEGALGRETQ